MSDLWYYSRNEQRHGPVPLLELRRLASSGNFDATDLVWSPGMEDWTSASEVDGLFLGNSSTVAAPPLSSPSVEPDVPVAEDQWHYENEGERCGPVAFEELQRLAVTGQVQHENLVWKRRMTEWTPAGQIHGLFSQPVVRLGLAPRPPTPQQADTETSAREDQWYYEHEGERCGPVSFVELQRLAASGQIQLDSLVWKRGMAEWMVAAEIEGLFSARTMPNQLPDTVAPEKPRKPVVPLVPTPKFKEQMQSIGNAFSEAATATRTNLERFRKFIHRQHLGTRLRLLASATARGISWCYNAARPHVIRAWNKRPSNKQVRDWSAEKAQQASEAWKRTAPLRGQLAQTASIGLNESRKGVVGGWNKFLEIVARSWQKAVEMVARAKAERKQKAADKAEQRAAAKAALKVAAKADRLKAEAERKAAGEAARLKAEAERKAKEEAARKIAEGAARTKAPTGTKSLSPEIAAAKPKPKPQPPETTPARKPLPADVATAAPKSKPPSLDARREA